MPLTFPLAIEDDEKQVREKTAKFVDQHIRPTVEQDDATSRYRRELFDGVAQLGFHAFPHPVQYGGKAGSYRCYYAFLEELGRGSLALSVSVGVTNLVQGALVEFGTEEQKERFLKPLTSGKYLGAFSLSEPQSGSDASALRLAARKKQGGYVFNGTKIWCSNAGHADLYLVMARTGEHKTRGISSFLVPANTPGFRIGKQEKKLGLRASTLAELVFEDCFIPQDQLLGEEGTGFQVALSQLDAGRISISAAGIAAATEALERALQYSHSEGTRDLFAEHFAKILSLKTMLTVAAQNRDAGIPITVLASSLKLLSSDVAVQVCHDAVHMLGYDGVRSGSGVERLLRDAKALQIVEGTNQVQRLVLARHLDTLLKEV